MKRYNKGQSLFEVILALALSTLIIVALVSLVSNSISNASYSKNKTRATRYTQEATEWLRGQRDADWDAFYANVGVCDPVYVQCLDTIAWGDCNICGDAELIGNIFKREVFFTNIAPDSVTVEVKTYWTDAQGTHEVRNSTFLTDWRTLF
jgi:Tfp pilus assembly protein PilV